MKNVLYNVCFFLFSQICFGQQQSEVLKYARQITDTLASPSMHGRGYVFKGDSLAAAYIKNEFVKLGLRPVGKSYYQKFNLSVNTFPGEMKVMLDGKKLIPGKDFIMDEHSSGGKGKYEVRYIKNSPAEYSRGARVFLDSMSRVAGHRSVLISGKNKLTSDLSQFHSDLLIIHFKDSSADYAGKKLTVNIENELIRGYESQNALGFVRGSQYPDSCIVFSAHYDHLGMMGKDVYFPGANDNASGCAMLLSLAKYYSQHPPKYSIIFMAFGGEEIGLLGSKYYTEHPYFPLKRIIFLVNMDIMGTGDEGIKVVNATEHKKEFDELVRINDEKKLLPSVQPRGKAANSDHYFFEEAGVKAFFIYTLGGIKAYHDIYDRPETLPLTKFEETYNLLINFENYLEK